MSLPHLHHYRVHNQLLTLNMKKEFSTAWLHENVHAALESLSIQYIHFVFYSCIYLCIVCM